MLKLLDIGQDFFGEEPSVSVLNINDLSGLQKTAADSRITEYVSGITPTEDKTYIHILAMGAGEYYGANRNGDYFPEENLLKYHDTFRTSPAHIFKHHINKNPEIAIGQVVYSVYNERMHRVEVIAWIDNKKAWDYVEKINRGEFPATSMACHTPYDTCSICGNKARSRQQYCTHLKNELGKLLPDGRKTMAINDGPLRFFDMSFVFKPADITSSVLQKVAKQNSAQEPVMSSLENAELWQLSEKKASIKKLSELIKEVEGQVVGSSPTMDAILAKIKDPDDDVLDALVGFDLHHVLHALAELGISPSVAFFAKLIGQKITGSPVDGIEHLVHGLLAEAPHELEVPEMAVEKSASDRIYIEASKRYLAPFVKQASLFADPVLERAVQRANDRHGSEIFAAAGSNILANSNNVGYAGNGPYIVTDPRSTYNKLKENAPKTEEGPGLLKTLFLIGGVAVAAKWLLSKMIEDKINAKLNEHAQGQQSQTKIVLVKAAEERLTSTKLVKMALWQDLTQNTKT